MGLHRLYGVAYGHEIGLGFGNFCTCHWGYRLGSKSLLSQKGESNGEEHTQNALHMGYAGIHRDRRMIYGCKRIIGAYCR